MREIVYDLQPFGRCDYDEVTEEFVSLFASKYGESVSLYRFGNAGHPPASDLDLALVLADDMSPRKAREAVADAKRFVRSDARTRYLFMHGILIYTPELFVRHPLVHVTIDLRHLYGPAFTVSDCEERQACRDLRFVSYATSALRYLEWLQRQKRTGLRAVLKGLQHAYHQFRLVDDSEAQSVCGDLAAFRQEMIAGKWSGAKEKALLGYFTPLAARFRQMYAGEMNRLAERVFERPPVGEVLVLENRGLSRRHRLFLALAGSFATLSETEGNCYARAHRMMFPVHPRMPLPREPYLGLIREQAKVLREFCRLHGTYGVDQVLGPMMCYHCPVGVSRKRQLLALLQKPLLRLQGL